MREIFGLLFALLGGGMVGGSLMSLAMSVGEGFVDPRFWSGVIGMAAFGLGCVLGDSHD